MAYIKTGIEEKGIRELLMYKPSTGEALLNLAQALLHGPSPIDKKNRELIAAYTSKLNQCEFCYESHKAAAIAHYQNEQEVNCILDQPFEYPQDNVLKLLFKIVEKVQKSGQMMTLSDIEFYNKNGVSDEMIHDTVLITAAFCMYNRYVDGLGAATLDHKKDYLPMGEKMAEQGYSRTSNIQNI